MKESQEESPGEIPEGMSSKIREIADGILVKSLKESREESLEEFRNKSRKESPKEFWRNP